MLDSFRSTLYGETRIILEETSLVSHLQISPADHLATDSSSDDSASIEDSSCYDRR
jgi:hypothetical protein